MLTGIVITVLRTISAGINAGVKFLKSDDRLRRFEFSLD